MRRAALIVVTVAVALAVPLLLTTTALRIVANDWIVSFEYDHGGVPPDRYGLTREQRGDLALVGLEAIRPGGRGIALLEEARLPDGKAAFGVRELTHMRDVRDAVGIAFAVQLAALALVLGLLVALAWRPASRRAVPRGIQLGSGATLAVATVIGIVMLVAWDGFFVRFHEMFFEGDTWRFSRTDTLLRLYPDEFWVGVAAWIAGITVTLALVLFVAATLLLRRDKADGERGSQADA
jgi:integral membrane protein (TIGR01906 family)